MLGKTKLLPVQKLLLVVTTINAISFIFQEDLSSRRAHQLACRQLIPRNRLLALGLLQVNRYDPSQCCGLYMM